MQDGESALIAHPDYKSTFEHLRDSARPRYLWVFSKEEANRPKLMNQIEVALRKSPEETDNL